MLQSPNFDNMYKLPKVLFIKTQQDMQGNGFLLSTVNPVVFGKVYTEKNKKDIDRWKELYPESISIDGYNILIIYFRCEGYNNHSLKEIDAALKDMAYFYLNEYIPEHLSYHKKFKTQ